MSSPQRSHLDDRGCPDASGIWLDPAAIFILGEGKGCIPHLPTKGLLPPPGAC